MKAAGHGLVLSLQITLDIVTVYQPCQAFWQFRQLGHTCQSVENDALVLFDDVLAVGAGTCGDD